jgi:hypothetical protein
MSSRPSQAEDLVRAAMEAGSFFHDGETAYADVEAPHPVPHQEILQVRSKAFRTWLGGRYWHANGRPAGGQALNDAVDVLGALARFDGPDRRVSIRIAEQQGAIYLDLADDRWRVVEVDSAGWRIRDRSPIPFRRPRGLAPLPVPMPGGSLDELRSFVNVRDDDQFRLLAGWLLAAFRTSGPYIVLLLAGEQDSAKSTTARLLRLLVDPNEVGDRSLPRDEQSMAIAAGNSWIASFDNVSTLADWRSDAIARLATGAGFSTRQLYSDDEEFLVHVSRPVILNGIGAVVTRADLLDRAIVLDLATIPDDQRRPEEEFWRAFEAARPRLLGALLSAVSVAFSRHDQVVIGPLPRMADATLWVTAAEGHLDWPSQSFLAAYRAKIAHRRAATLEASPLAAPISMLLATADRWSGTATDLLRVLEQRVDAAAIRRRDWPKTAAVLGTARRRLAPDLRKVEGIDIQFPQHHGSGRTIALVRVRESLSPVSRDDPGEDGRDSRDNDLSVSTARSQDGDIDLVAEAKRIFGDDLLLLDASADEGLSPPASSTA